ncbi:MAG: DUF389 domain-containing protein [Acidobacteria bacterium]|nr:DUF389 domain-containing protein [Acidobacteriota bacterium]
MRVQDRLSRLLGIEPENRVGSLIDLYQATERHPLAYWLQLAIAAGIAHLGLVLNSTGVVIGAMLVSPLMTPIVQVGVSFSIGHPYLAARATTRTLKSIVFVVGLAALMTLLLPFQEVTSEILARTQPTALDLAVALFCGLAAAFTAARNAHDVFTAAAGTAIAIALVPPLCVAGFGVGTANAAVATGSLLLFTANLSAIILVTDLFFLALGFGRENSQKVEPEALKDEDRRSLLFRFFGSTRINGVLARWHHLRLILPLLFVVVVAFPLGVALRRVTWEINTKHRVSTVLDDFEKKHRVLRRQSIVSHGAVTVRLTVVGTPGSETALRGELLTRLAAAAGRPPNLALEVIPSSEYMNRSLQQSSEQLNRQLAELRFGMNGADGPYDVTLLAKAPSPALEEALRGRCRAFFTWLGETDPAAGWYGWALEIGDQGDVLTLGRLVGKDTPTADTTLLAAVFEREAGLSVTVREERVDATVFASERPVNGTGSLDPAFRALDGLAAGVPFRARLELRDPAGARGARTRSAWERMNAELTRRAKERFPGDRLDVVADGERWALILLPAAP